MTTPMPRCSACRWFSPNTDFEGGYPHKDWGDCTRFIDGYTYAPDADGPADGRLAIAWDYEGASAGLYVSPNFGCVQWEPKP